MRLVGPTTVSETDFTHPSVRAGDTVIGGVGREFRRARLRVVPWGRAVVRFHAFIEIHLCLLLGLLAVTWHPEHDA